MEPEKDATATGEGCDDMLIHDFSYSGTLDDLVITEMREKPGIIVKLGETGSQSNVDVYDALLQTLSDFYFNRKETDLVLVSTGFRGKGKGHQNYVKYAGISTVGKKDEKFGVVNIKYVENERLRRRDPDEDFTITTGTITERKFLVYFNIFSEEEYRTSPQKSLAETKKFMEYIGRN